jgi:hydroxymethylpyrimidine pyrophosphatase-like HAD family hydrolase
VSVPHLIALDIDGTTIDHDGHLSDAVREAVQAVVEAGHHVVIATGRTIVGTLPIIEALALPRGYAVCCNGAVTIALDPGRVPGYDLLEAVTFDPTPANWRERWSWCPGKISPPDRSPA